MLFKNVASQGVYLFLIDSSTGAGKTGDSSNVSVTISLDGGATAASTNSVSEIGGGVYTLTLTQGETNADRVAIIPSSSTASVVGSPIIAYTTGGAVPAAAAGASTGLALTSSVDDVETKIDTVDSNVDAILVDTGTTIPATIATVDTVVDSILEDTGTTIPATIATVDTVVDAVKAVTDNLPDSGALSSLATASALATVDGNVDAILVDTGTTIPATLSTLDGKVDTVDTVADAIKAVTDNLPDSGALSSLATAAALATVDGNVDAVLTDTGTTLPATLSTIEGKVDTVDTVVDSISSTLSSGVTVATISDGAIGADAVADIWSTTALAESYASDGSTGTGSQLLYQIQQALTEFAISSTTVTVKKLDGSTTASTYTLDDASAPTSRTRAS